MNELRPTSVIIIVSVIPSKRVLDLYIILFIFLLHLNTVVVIGCIYMHYLAIAENGIQTEMFQVIDNSCLIVIKWFLFPVDLY